MSGENKTRNSRAYDLMKLLTVVGTSSAIIAGVVTWLINYGVASGETQYKIIQAEKERELIFLSQKENQKKTDDAIAGNKKRLRENEKKIIKMSSDIDFIKRAVKRIEEKQE